MSGHVIPLPEKGLETAHQDRATVATKPRTVHQRWLFDLRQQVFSSINFDDRMKRPCSRHASTMTPGTRNGVPDSLSAVLIAKLQFRGLGDMMKASQG
jgi:hypothetical protein